LTNKNHFLGGGVGAFGGATGLAGDFGGAGGTVLPAGGGGGVLPAGGGGGVFPAGGGGGVLPAAGGGGGALPAAGGGGVFPAGGGGVFPAGGGVLPAAGGVLPAAGGVFPAAGLGADLASPGLAAVLAPVAPVAPVAGVPGVPPGTILTFLGFPKSNSVVSGNISVTIPAAIVLPPSLKANLAPLEIVIGKLSLARIVKLSPGFAILIFSGRQISAAVSAVLK